MMLNKRILVLIVMIFISCKKSNNQESTLKVENSSNTQNVMEEKEIKIFKEYFNNNGLKSDYDFSAIINYKLGIDNSQVTETGYTQIEFFDEDSDYVLSTEGKYIKEGAGILPDLDNLKESIKTEKNAFFQNMLTLNKILFLNDKNAITNLSNSNNDLKNDLVILFNYEKDDNLTTTALKNLSRADEFPNYYLKSFLWFNRIDKERIRKKMLQNLVKINPSFTYDLTRFLFSDRNKNDKQIDSKLKFETLAYLLEIQLSNDDLNDLNDNRGYQLLQEFYKEDKALKITFKNTNYYRFQKLEKYSDIENPAESEYTKRGYIEDKDGFTNIRKDKNSSSEILGTVKTGSEIEIIKKNGDWWFVITQDGKKGYVHKSKIIVD
ncbi:SH3 domain-containing protein [Flavobacterium columnare]|uniref:SH3 domain-containing protein n=1 Tax=Flavobacterium columnare TaxID=996 RepID=A0AAI8CIJ3_9FLAO|nr:SH3 domain-containing protein [Flavobacterium columnare]AMO20441.2 SH3 domain-containing protein [Flavobacterium columnare]MEB3801366.1 SH3 domain-containing protein [Flavobacterium columnare]QOG57488.1 SH3 domain-containing protein [Flavobacterium columnare]QOG60212.1 SH3 domain-containing protein [Flavobacterium columnare]QOG62932.1 SH3 domain-containing protein [Flavobacterium columnare]